MKAASLFAVFVVAKICVLWGRPLPLSAWTPLAMLWPDLAVALVFAVIERVVRPARVSTALYWVLVAYAALNVPIIRVLSSPLTLAMLPAARGTLSESVFYYVNATNLALIGLVLGSGAALAWRWPRVAHDGAQRTRARRDAGIPAAAIVLAMLGSVGAAQVDTAGLERNSVLALMRSALPRVRSAPGVADWRSSPFARDSASPSDPRLATLRGVARGRNVLLIVLESAGAGYLSSYGARDDPTPRLTALARNALVIENAYTAYPESIKGLVATLASRYPRFDVSATDHASLASPSLATVLRAERYASALFHSGRFMYLGMDTIVHAAGFDRTEDAGDIGGNRNSSFGVDEVATVARILAWIDRVPRTQRFFATYLPIAGHHPYAYSVAAPFPAREEIDRYRNALYEGDLSVGALLDGLRARGLDTNTLVVVIGDHGEAFGQHPGNYGHSLSIFEENIRVPMLFAAAGADLAGRVRATASLIDLPPTILDLLALAAPSSFEGESILAGRQRMALFFTDYSLGLIGLRDGCMKFIHEIESGRSKLFDLCADPAERNDLGTGLPERVTNYRARVKAWIAAHTR